MIKEIQKKYTNALNSISSSTIDPRLINTLIKSKVYGFDNNILQIVVDDPHVCLLASTTYYLTLKQTLVKEFEYFNQPVQEILFLSPQEVERLNQRSQLIKTLEKPVKTEIINFKKELKELTFSRLVKTTYNMDAINAIHQLLSSDYMTYSQVNPIFIFGKVGIGKTHLVAAAANEYHKNNPTKVVYYIEAAEYFRRFNAAAFKGAHVVEQLKNEIQAAELLIIDDIQNLGDKAKALEMFFNIFNTIINNGGKIIITCDKKTSELVAFETRLISRLASGIQIKLSNPSISDAIDIINNWLTINKQFTISTEAVEYIAYNFHKDIRQLIGFLKQISYWAMNSHEKVNHIELGFLQEKCAQSGIGLQMIENELDPNKIITMITQYMNINEQLILSDTRRKEVVWVRSVVIYVLRRVLNMTFTEIASVLKMKSHSTISYAFDKVARKADEDDMFKQQLNHIIEYVSKNE
ncbi:DnaA ATPase domain-containing protein [Ureaplasma zalophigenitalium]|uniref:Chromosomal replication initiator protein DnaA n=1 Tax=Ureaplasma zalophigenitalium TaxID=907723 RepID=A0ABT3BQ05_9BACT|nr:DnaA/Hda family protein [Ureaplasma zalophigenitalium]MCV3754319.1 DnaA/Hda family protein [Ureaplasma zalophigenitalium]